MKRIIILLLLLSGLTVKAQKMAGIWLFTDRDVYTSGESILINVYASGEEKSGIVHIDLINTNGKIITGINKILSNNQTDGFIFIPDSLKTGSYLLCTSTRTNPSLAVKELLICNRFTGFSETTSLFKVLENFRMVEKEIELDIEGYQKSFKSGAKAELKLHLPPEILSSLKSNLSISIASYTPGYKSVTFNKPSETQNSQISEKNGVLLEGYAKDIVTGAPFQNGCIFLSVPDSIPELNYFITGRDGYFNFELNNCYGKIDVVLQGFDMEKKRLLKITPVHRDSITDCIPVFGNLNVSSELLDLTKKNMEATTLSKIFNYQDFNINIPTLVHKKDYPFYGVPNEVIHPNLFTDLPDFTEISRELLPGVKFRAYNRIPTLQILNPSSLNYFNNQPLLLLDGIPVQDLSIIKNMGTKDISRIEICRRERFYGDLNFQGVVAIYSTNGDYNRLTESNDLIKISLDAIQPDFSLKIPMDRPANEPDLRKVLLWDPNIKPEETIRIDFKTSDITGSYQLVVHGIAKDGSVFFMKQIFEVN